MEKRNIGNFFIVMLIVVNVSLWLIFPPINDGRPHFLKQNIGEIFSTSALLLFSCNIFISTRARFMEPYFGGLDQMYQTHKKNAVTAIILIFTHFFIMTLGSPLNLGLSLGKIALIGLLVSVILALAPRIPFIGGYLRLKYQDWKIVHKFIGVFVIVGLLHMSRVQNLLQTTRVVQVYVLSIAYFGVAVYLYKELLEPLLKRKFPYVVEGVRRLNGAVVEVTFKPQRRKVSHRAGQFMFVDFRGDKVLKEPHPFTISSAPASDNLKLAIKASGDFTQHLYNALEPGREARIEGGYGMFDYKTASPKQLWIAGGIGLTPFLSWIRDFDKDTSQEIDFVYTTRVPEEALYLDEIEAGQARNKNFHFHLHFSNRDGRISADKIVQASGPAVGKEIFLCGPFPMTESLKSQFMAMGVPARNIHYEEFSFR